MFILAAYNVLSALSSVLSMLIVSCTPLTVLNRRSHKSGDRFLFTAGPGEAGTQVYPRRAESTTGDNPGSVHVSGGGKNFILFFHAINQ